MASMLLGISLPSPHRRLARTIPAQAHYTAAPCLNLTYIQPHTSIHTVARTITLNFFRFYVSMRRLTVCHPITDRRTITSLRATPLPFRSPCALVLFV